MTEVEVGYDHKCDFCVRSFKTKGGCAAIHRVQFAYNYDTTDEVFELEEVTTVFGHKDTHWFRMK